MSKKTCPCYSGSDYEECCAPFHRGVLPKNALQLMRSRYSAYALNLSDYIISTTHPDNPLYSADTITWKKKIADFSKNREFQNLQIHDFQETGSKAIVIFTAFLAQTPQNNATFTEKSYFEKVNERWLYLNGEIF